MSHIGFNATFEFFSHFNVSFIPFFPEVSLTPFLPQRGGLTALHIAAAIPGEEGVVITELLLNSLASPDARAAHDDAFLNRSLVSTLTKDGSS